ncbi:hypothetical protein FQR65_LT11853 [Abscondita terminalis]|nr:hypothetical protein FQR65_LT11853 [Abscondita terminalis]
MAWLMYGFAHDWSVDQIIRECADLADPEHTLLSSATITAWTQYCREMVIESFNDIQDGQGRIGGEGIVVQVDEAVFGHRKYERGRIIPGHWVIGLIADGSDNVRMAVVEDRSAASLIPQIEKFVLPGSIIHTDSWKGYNRVIEHGYTHRKCNHSDPEHRFVGKFSHFRLGYVRLILIVLIIHVTAADGTHTQRIESTWRPAKDWFRGVHPPQDQFAFYLCEYLWRRHCRKLKIDPFEAVLQAIRREYGDFRAN